MKIRSIQNTDDISLQQDMAGQGVIILLAPSKTMDTISPCPWPIAPQTALFLPQTKQIVTKLQKLSVPKIQKLMGISLPIAQTVHDYYDQWAVTNPGKPALWSYTGDVYKGLQAPTMSLSDSNWAQKHLVIASGLYGLVRPYDGVQAYRLEMKASLGIGRHKTLSEFWGNALVQYVQEKGYDWLCNCSSEEYSRPVVKGLALPVITPVFFDTKPNGVVGQVPIYSKLMRGVFARWIIDHRVTSPDQLSTFQAHGYKYDAIRSLPSFPAFSRVKMVPLRFN